MQLNAFGPLGRSLEVLYTRSKSVRLHELPQQSAVLVLTADQYSSYGRNATFNVVGVKDGKQFDVGQVRLLLMTRHGELTHLNKLALSRDTRLISFPIKDQLYLSIGLGTDYYRRLLSLFPQPALLPALRAMHDLVAVEQSDESIEGFERLRRSKYFQSSLLRGVFARQAAAEAHTVLFGSELRGDRELQTSPPPPAIGSFLLTFKLESFEGPHRLRFDFTEGNLPSNINVIIGSNGSGKTQALRHLADYLLDRGVGVPQRVLHTTALPLSPRPSFSQVIVASFSPFDIFPRTSNLGHKQDLEYLYCGFRDQNGRFSVRYATSEMAKRLIWIVQQDRKAYTSDWASKVKRLNAVLSEAVDFDDIVISRAVTTKGSTQELRFSFLDTPDFTPDELDSERFDVQFRLNGSPVLLSSGQMLFAFLVTTIVAVVRRHSLILVDEPELYLHPNLEIAFMRMLKTLLGEFSAYSIVATHSAIVAREVPSRCVQVLNIVDRRIPIAVYPSFQTFGADISRISNYAFNDPLIGLPHQEWLLSHYGSASFESLLRDDNDLNIESIAFLRNTRDMQVGE